MVGVTAALIGSAALSAGAGLMASSSNNKQINAAAAQSAADNAAARALQEKVYNQNNALLSPFVARGNAAGETMNALLGLPGAAASPTTASAAPTDYAAYVAANPDLTAEFQRVGGQFGGDANAYGQYHWNAYGQKEGRQLPQQQVSAATSVTPQTAQSAFDTFRNSTGYQFRVDEGNKSLNALNFARGASDSGAAVKSALNYGQNIASGEFGNYMGYLGNQQGVGLSGASAVAGVGQNYANNTANLLGQNSQNAWNTAQAKTQSNNSLASNLTTSFGKIGSALSGFGTNTTGGWNGTLPSSTLPDIWSIKL